MITVHTIQLNPGNLPYGILSLLGYLSHVNGYLPLLFHSLSINTVPLHYRAPVCLSMSHGLRYILFLVLHLNNVHLTLHSKNLPQTWYLFHSHDWYLTLWNPIIIVFPQNSAHSLCLWYLSSPDTLFKLDSQFHGLSWVSCPHIQDISIGHCFILCTHGLIKQVNATIAINSYPVIHAAFMDL